MPEILDSLLAPLARLLVARGVPFPAFAERMKGHYVRAAAAQVDSQGHKVTDSRLSVLTGLHRRDIARLRAFEEKPPRPSPLTRLVARWVNDPAYKGAPLARSGPAPSFEALAREVIQDVHPRTLLDTLLETGTCEEKDATLHLRSHAYVPAVGSEDQMEYLASNVGDHLWAATENVLGSTQEQHFERALHLSGLTEGQLAALKSRYVAAQMALLEDMQREGEAMKTKATGPHRLRAGGFFYAKPLEART